MGIFSQTSPYDAITEKATNENNTSDKWVAILSVCDQLNTDSNPNAAKECLKSIIKRLKSANPHVSLQALTLIDACVKNCGKRFQLEVSSRVFADEVTGLMKNQRVNSQVRHKLKKIIREWVKGDFSKGNEFGLLRELAENLPSSGLKDVSSAEKSTAAAEMRAREQLALKKEEEDLKKALELSLKEAEKQQVNRAPQSSIYPSMTGNMPEVKQEAKQGKEARKVRALYDFEAAENDELTFKAGEVILLTDDSDANWWRGSNQRGEGLFPSNFVTSDLNEDIFVTIENTGNLRKVTFSENSNDASEANQVEENLLPTIQPEIIDKALQLLHDADPTGTRADNPEMQKYQAKALAMAPLLDTELEKIDRQHIKLMSLSTKLFDAMKEYHENMAKESAQSAPYSNLAGYSSYTPQQPYANPPYYQQNQPAQNNYPAYSMPQQYYAQPYVQNPPNVANQQTNYTNNHPNPQETTASNQPATNQQQPPMDPQQWAQYQAQWAQYNAQQQQQQQHSQQN